MAYPASHGNGHRDSQLRIPTSEPRFREKVIVPRRLCGYMVSMATPDFNQQLFASGQMQGSLGAHGGGQTASLPLLAALGAKDARNYWFESLNPPQAVLAGLVGGDTNGIAGIFTPKSGDKWIQGLTNVGGSGTGGFGGAVVSEGSTSGSYFQGLVASSRGHEGERSVG